MRNLCRRQFFLGAAIIAATANPLRALAAAIGRSDIDPLSLVDPDLREELLKIQPEMDKEIYSVGTLKDMRKLSIGMAEAPDEAPSAALKTIPGAAGQPSVDVYVINQQKASKRPAILHIHGGGYIIGRAIDGVKRLQKIATENDCLVVTVDYRLAPEAKFPASLEDNYAALAWVHDHADETRYRP